MPTYHLGAGAPLLVLVHLGGLKDADERDIPAHETILTGDLNGDDKTDQVDLGILFADWGCDLNP